MPGISSERSLRTSIIISVQERI
jgi:hypothetical protein